jgi:uncharacterized membrane protein YesL
LNINGLFNPNNIFFKFMGRISDLMILNFLWIVFSIPIVTIGASTTALYNTTLKLVDETEGYMLTNYFNSFKQNFKKATTIWIGELFIICIIGVNLVFWIQFKSIVGYVAVGILIFITFLFLLTTVYLFPILSSFNRTIKDIVKKACILSLRYLPYSLVILLISSIFMGIILIFPFTILFMIFVGVAFYAYINSYLFKMIFKKCIFYLEQV